MADVTVPGGEQRLLVGIDAGDVEAAFQVFREAVVLAQQLAGFGEQGVVLGTAQIGDSNPRRVRLPAGAPDWMQKLITDPQTSGGLLVACDPSAESTVLPHFAERGFAEAQVIGALSAGPARVHVA